MMSIYKVYKKDLIQKPLLWSFIASASLLVIYFLILSIANSINHAFQQFIDLWYWMTPLVLGFGLQVGLFVYVKKYAKIKAENALSGSAVATAGSISAASMIACCAHHVADIIPILGVSAAAMFLAQYQALFLAIGVVSNLIGITIMFKIIQKHELYINTSFLGKIMRIDMKKALYINIVLGIIILIIVSIHTL